jgi:hypothetical protein
MSKCAVKDCERVAQWRPVLLVFTEGVQQPLRLQLGTKVCNQCKSKSRDALSALVKMQRERLEPMVTAAGRKNPDWENVGVAFHSAHFN